MDILVEFNDSADLDYIDSFFGLREGLDQLLNRPVDLITTTSIHNPYWVRLFWSDRAGDFGRRPGPPPSPELLAAPLAVPGGQGEITSS